MSSLGQLGKKAARSKGMPVSSKEKLLHLVQGLAGLVNAIDQNPAEMTLTTCSNMAEYLLNSVGYILKRKQGDTNVGTDTKTEA